MDGAVYDRPISPDLLETLRTAQRLGFFGDASIEHMVEHARQYLVPLGRLDEGGRVCDLGSGGGLPALVIAMSRPDLSITMVDRRQKRTDFLRRAQSRLRMKNVEIVHADVTDVVKEIDRSSRPFFDGVTARGFGPPSLFLSTAAQLVEVGGIAVISEPPEGKRWSNEEVRAYGLTIDQLSSAPTAGFDGGVQTFIRVTGEPIEADGSGFT